MIVSKPKLRQKYQTATQISTEILAQVKDATHAGVLPMELERITQKLCKQYQVTPAFQGVGPANNRYKYALCLSVNDAVLHGIPEADRPLQTGDLVKLDFGIIYQGLYTDQCVTVGIEKLSAPDRKLVEATRSAVQAALPLAVTGNTTGDLGATMQQVSNQAGFSTLKDYIGHGIGESLHEDPGIPAYGKIHTGPILKKGMVLCIEAQVVAGSTEVYTLPDGWTVKTKDRQKAAMFEYMVIVGDEQPQLLTPTLDWEIIVQ